MLSICDTLVPMICASSKIEMPAASASVAKGWGNWYAPRCLIPAASSAGYQSRLRQVVEADVSAAGGGKDQGRVEPRR